MAENDAESLSSVEEKTQKETKPSSAAEIPKSDSSKQGVEEDELDGLPVFGAVEDEGDVESSPTQKDKQTDGRDERENGNAVSLGDNDAGEGVQSSRVEDRPSQTEGSESSQEPGEGSQKEILSSPLKKIKDEPIDEDYDKALVSSANSDISRVKEELENGDNESLVPLDELRISSVFSVRGNSDSISAPLTAPQPAPFSAITQRASPIRPPPIVLQAQMPPHFQAHLQLQPKTLAQLQPHLQTHLQAQLQTHLQPQLQLQAQLQAHLQTQLQPQLSHQLQPQLSHQIPLHPQLPHQLQPQTPPQLQTQPPSHPQPQPTHQLQPQPQPPPGPVRICCSGCSKVLQKGQTAFQKKGSNQLFCSTVCLTGFTLPPAPNIAPKKTCHLCLKVIGNPKDLITVPVDSANNLKEFCSLSCLSIYKSRVEGLTEEESIVRCSVCRNPSEIQHEVNHQGVLHRLCSDECFSRFRSSKRLSMSCCESCGNCTVTGNYHLVQIEDAIKKFCSPACITTFKQKSGKRVHCPCCQDFKAMDQMMEGTNAQGVIEFFCSSRCVANSQASCTLSGASFPCTNCQKLAVPQYHLAMSDGSIRNFCSYECVGRFQERLQRSSQMNGGSYHSPNMGPQPPVPLHPSSVPASVQNTTPPSVPASRPTNSHDPQQQAEAPGPAKLTCKQCQKQFSSKPEVLQFKNHTGLFCSRLCCDMYKRERDVGAVCEYCKEEKMAKEIVMYDKQPRTFCCEGCKLLYKHDYAKQHGGQSRVCAYCSNVTHKSLQNHFGGKLEEFCSKECMSLYTVLFYEMAKCHACRNQGPLKESIRWDEMVRHFCNLQCLLHFCSKSIIPDQPNSNERSPLSKALELVLESIAGDNSEVEDLSDIDDPIEDVDYRPPQQEPSSSEEESSGDEDPTSQSTVTSRGRKRHHSESDGSNNDPEEPTPGPSFQGQPKQGRGVCWRTAQLTPNLVQFEPGEETEQDRESWTTLDYVNQYIDKDLIKLIVNCSNATTLARSGYPLSTSVDEMFHFFGASILMSCVPYPQIRMYWSSALSFPAITERFTRDRFYKLRHSIKVVIDDDIPEDLRECDKFWKVRPFLDRILKGCRSQTRPESVSIDEQIIPFTGACSFRQYLPMKPNPVGMKNFVCASPEGIMLDFELYQGADALIAQVQEPGELGLGGLVIDRLSETLHPGTKVYCDRFFTSIKTVNRMMAKQVYLTGTVLKNRVSEAVLMLPSDKTMKKNGRGTSAQVTTEDGKICVVKWYDNKPVLMLSVVHDAQPEDTCKRWDKKQKQYVSIRRPNIVREYNKMGGVDLTDRMISYYRMSVRTKKWTLRMLMHFTDVALANSWLLYRQDHTVRGTPRKGIMQFLEFRMEVAKTFLAQHNNAQEDSTDLSEQEDNTDHSEPKKKRSVKEVPHISVRRRANAHLPEVVNLKNAARCRATGCSGKTRVRCVTCKVFLCLQAERNCYTVFHSG